MSMPVEPPCFNQVVSSELQSCVDATTRLLDSVSSLPKDWLTTGCKEEEPRHSVVVLLHQSFLCSRYAVDACGHNDLYSMALLMRTILGFHHNFFYLVLPRTNNLRYAHHQVFIIHGLMKAFYIHKETQPGEDKLLVQERNIFKENAEKHTLSLKKRCPSFIVQERITPNPKITQLAQWLYSNFELLRDEYLKSERLLEDLDVFTVKQKGLISRGDRDVDRYLKATLPKVKDSPSGPLYKFLSTYHHTSYFALMFTPANRDTLMGQMLQSVAEMTYFMAIASHARYFSKLSFPTNSVNAAYRSAMDILAPYMNSSSK